MSTRRSENREPKVISARDYVGNAYRAHPEQFPDFLQSNLDFINGLERTLKRSVHGFSNAWSSLKQRRRSWVVAKDLLTHPRTNLEPTSGSPELAEILPNDIELYFYQFQCSYLLASAVAAIRPLFLRSNAAHLWGDFEKELQNFTPVFFNHEFQMAQLPIPEGLWQKGSQPEKLRSFAIFDRLTRLRVQRKRDLETPEIILINAVLAEQMKREDQKKNSITVSQLATNLSVSNVRFRQIERTHLGKEGNAEFLSFMRLIQDYSLQVFKLMSGVGDDAYDSTQEMLDTFIEVPMDANSPQSQFRSLSQGMHIRDTRDHHLSEIQILQDLRLIDLIIGEPWNEKFYQGMLEGYQQHNYARIYFTEEINQVIPEEEGEIDADKIKSLIDALQTAMIHQFTVQLNKEELIDAADYPDFVDDVTVTGILAEESLTHFKVSIISGEQKKHFTFWIDWEDGELIIDLKTIDAEEMSENLLKRFVVIVQQAAEKFLTTYQQTLLEEASHSAESQPEAEQNVDSISPPPIVIEYKVREKGLAHTPKGAKKRTISNPQNLMEDENEEEEETDRDQEYGTETTRYILVLSEEVQKMVERKMDPPVLARILAKINNYNSPDENKDPEGKIKVLSDRSKMGGRKIVTLRVGDYRVLAQVEKDNEAVIYDIVHRGRFLKKIYKNKK